MAKIDYKYHASESQILRYQQVPLIDRLRWLEDICVFTKMVRQAPAKRRTIRAPAKTGGRVRQRADSAR